MKRVHVLIVVLILCLFDHSVVFSKQKGKVELVFHSMTIKPDVAMPNDTVNVTVMYELKGIDASGIEVNETKNLLFNEREVASLEKRKVMRSDGKWTIETTFLVPASATYGKYEVRQVVYSKYFSKSKKGFFRIEPEKMAVETRLDRAEVYTEQLKAELEADIEETLRASAELKRKKEEIQKSQTQELETTEPVDRENEQTASTIEEESLSGDEVEVGRNDDVQIDTNELESQQRKSLETKGEGSHSERLKIDRGLKIEDVIEKRKGQQDHVEIQPILEADKLPGALLSQQGDEKVTVSAKGTLQSNNKGKDPAEQKENISVKRVEKPELLKTPDATKRIPAVTETKQKEMREKESFSKEQEIPAGTITMERPEYSRATRKKDVDPGWVSNSNQKDPRISKLAKRDVLKDGGFGPWMIVFPLGSFSMGGEGYNEKPVHTVNIENQYSIMMHEVTVDMYQQYQKSLKGDAGKTVELWKREYPVVNVSWLEAKRFAAWLSEQASHTYRLPTEAEWEYVAKYCEPKNPISESLLFQNSFYESESQIVEDQRVEVVFNSLGDACKIYGLKGNVWEWTENCWAERYYREHNVQDAYMYPNCGSRTVRGGSYMEEREKQTPTLRMGVDQKTKVPYIGFRLVREGGF